jgi:acetoin utilization protein AcuB
MKTSECMSRNVTTIPATASCRDAVGIMYRQRIRHLPVVDATDSIAGIVTDRDLRHRLFAPSVFPEIGTVPVETLLGATPVSSVMSAPVVTVGPEDDLGAAAHRMLEDKVGSLPVVEGGRVVGIITETDLLRRIVDADSCAQEVETIIVSYP